MRDTTKPTRALGPDAFQPVRISQPGARRRGRGCSWPFILLGALILVYFLGPLRTNILLLGSDDSPERGALGRTDTIIMTTIVPLQPYVGMMSIPRDLWLPIPGQGEQRINTAYFFAEAQQEGSGPGAILGTIQENFRVPVHYYILIHMEGLAVIIDALGGVDISLTEPMGGLLLGKHHLDGAQALAFARERYTGSDFSRMRQGQVLIQAIVGKVVSPTSWSKLPGLMLSSSQVVETNISFWQWPRLAFSVIRAPLFGVDARSIMPEMVSPFTTSQGAQVLAPIWELIHPYMKDMFGN